MSCFTYLLRVKAYSLIQVSVITLYKTSVTCVISDCSLLLLDKSNHVTECNAAVIGYIIHHVIKTLAAIGLASTF